MLFAVSLALFGTAVLLGAQAARLGSFALPNLGLASLLLVAGAVFLFAPPFAETFSPSRLAFFGLLLAAAGFSLLHVWAVLRSPLSPLVARVSRIEDGSRRFERVERIGSLDFADRKHLVRLTGERHDVSVDIQAFLFVPQSGTYRFDMSCDDRCSLFLAGIRVLETIGPGSARLQLAEGIWTSGASGWERFYLNAMPMAIPLAVSRLSRLPAMHSVHLTILLVVYAAAHGMRILFHLYNGG